MLSYSESRPSWKQLLEIMVLKYLRGRQQSNENWADWNISDAMEGFLTKFSNSGRENMLQPELMSPYI